MAGFYVVTGELETFARRLDVLAESLRAAERYAAAGVRADPADAGVFLGHLLSMLDRVRGSIDAVLVRLRELTGASAVNIRHTAQVYRLADQEARSGVEAVHDRLPGSDPDSWPVGQSGSAVGPGSSRCLDSLREPQAREPLPPLIYEMLTFQDKASIAWVLNWLIDRVCGVDPFEWVAEQVAGDFEGLSRAGNAVQLLGDFFAALSQDLLMAQVEVSAYWQGEAAAAADRYFRELAAEVTALGGTVSEIGEDVQVVAASVYCLGQGAQSFVQEMADYALAAVLSTVASAALASTGVGVFAGIALTLYLEWEAGQAWLKALAYHGRAIWVVQGVTGAMGLP